VFLNDVTEARRLAEEHLAELEMFPPIEVTVLDGSTIETDFGWVFFWTSKQYAETGDEKYALAGNAPLIVDRRDGSVHSTSTAHPVEAIIETYRRGHPTARS
jgi:hypothetical protein